MKVNIGYCQRNFCRRHNTPVILARVFFHETFARAYRVVLRFAGKYVGKLNIKHATIL